MSSLLKLFDKYGCDKGSRKHRYDRVYASTLDQLKNSHFQMLEIGIFKGNSTEAFIEYCPQVEIVGVDIFVRVDVKNIPILNHPRVHPCKGDSMLPLTNECKKLCNVGVDIIIDDGLHTHRAQRKTFLNFIPYLKKGGVYFIEDVWAFDKMSQKQKQHPWLQSHSPAFSEVEYQKLLDAIEPYTVIYHDLRKGYRPDTFILEIRK